MSNRQGAFILYPICKAKNLSKFVFHYHYEILIKLEEKFIKFFKHCYFNQLMLISYHDLTLYHTILTFNDSKKEAF